MSEKENVFDEAVSFIAALIALLAFIECLALFTAGLTYQICKRVLGMDPARAWNTAIRVVATLILTCVAAVLGVILSFQAFAIGMALSSAIYGHDDHWLRCMGGLPLVFAFLIWTARDMLRDERNLQDERRFYDDVC